jgi:hypothetical protein
MIWLALALLLHATDPAVVQPGETLDAVAQRVTGDAAAAAELRALNPGLGDPPKAGTHLRLPGPERALARSALSSARHAVDQSGPGPEREKAQGQLAQATALFTQARYAEAANAADSAWKLLNHGRDASTRFAVDVDKDGTTQVSAKAGQPVRVESEGKMVSVGPGQRVLVHKGEVPQLAPPPPMLVESLLAPRLLAPSDHRKLTFKKKGPLGPIQLSWAAVRGAESYAIEVSTSGGAPALQLSSKRPRLTLPKLPPGSYQWTVKALGATGESPRSEPRAFELVRAGMKLEVHETKWK